jgi:hypothetical protein
MKYKKLTTKKGTDQESAVLDLNYKNQKKTYTLPIRRMCSRIIHLHINNSCS